MSSSFKSSFSITHITTASAILHINGINFLTDPVFSPAGTEWDMGLTVLRNTKGPALQLDDLPVIDAILLSHENHPDNLDELGRRLLDGRRVLTTEDGARKLAPRPGVAALRPRETTKLRVGGEEFEVTGVPCQHLPGGEVTGFLLRAASFGETNGLPNVIYISGDTVYLEEIPRLLGDYHISVAIVNVGAVEVAISDPPLLVTMDGKQAARLFLEIGADVLVPMHYESWAHFAENGDQLRAVFEEEGIADKVQWLEPGVETKIF
ncbi:hypothetical protein CORC01_01473 [Colletotrichum orchidophilum]|uniref:Metallo-beta-lactamase domain-containing protein n=1 Tax=Colletotrichum orchidophilum TaxID=1209926 RepID=A0A1G4BNR3_9PEZI|nr:uncharacterized protein CORC01_01473 [Colletotrichum orchidophilum]OHF03089.1 hypothetical protein CORC01_01473 [Colletotrichum orchidophilum]